MKRRRGPSAPRGPARPAPPEARERPPAAPPNRKRLSLPLAEAPAARAELVLDGLPPFAPFDGPDDLQLCAIATVRLGAGADSIRCDVGGIPLRRGEMVVVDTPRGPEIGVVTAPPRRELARERPAHRCLRRAGENDLRAERKQRLREADALRLATRTVSSMKLPLKVVRAECAPGGGRVVIHLASEDRVELRDLAKRLSAAIQGRVELRHVGVREAAKAIGGVGPCGLQLCCNTFLSEFAPVSIRHAKEQGLALNPQRVSGVCGRLMCCLVYEDAFYRQQRALFPRHGRRVITPKGEGRVRDVDVLARTVRVVFGDHRVETFEVEAVRALGGDTAEADPLRERDRKA